MLPRVPRELRVSFARNISGVLAEDVLSDLPPGEYDAVVESIRRIFQEHRPPEAPAPVQEDPGKEAAPQSAPC